jgi:hypothetical protein
MTLTAGSLLIVADFAISNPARHDMHAKTVIVG